MITLKNPTKFPKNETFRCGRFDFDGRKYSSVVVRQNDSIIYDETISTLKSSVEKAKMGENDKQEALKKLTRLAQKAEENFTPNDDFEAVLQKERDDAWKYGGRTMKGYSKPPQNRQLGLFE